MSTNEKPIKGCTIKNLPAGILYTIFTCGASQYTVNFLCLSIHPFTAFWLVEAVLSWLPTIPGRVSSWHYHIAITRSHGSNQVTRDNQAPNMTTSHHTVTWVMTFVFKFSENQKSLNIRFLILTTSLSNPWSPISADMPCQRGLSWHTTIHGRVYTNTFTAGIVLSKSPSCRSEW